ncbi:methylamine utilization protein MauE [Kribbella albertanoniae]|uniref:Methylamine utilization protein MauE n=1 Tax=Kribbella albertanoniae TaxID=1266829 RepID=A0A4R4QAQ8_9ACTN|nr:MauE/DoxX family redox-associated membrane protein [Kribbella albertanoniae]TDC32481.1 methylamine utilization protein MauE [Kribbella albertanoniae]
MIYLLLGCCLCLAFVFGQSAASKTGSKAFRDFAGSAGPLEILPTGLRVPAAAGVVVAEVTLTVALLVGAFFSLRFVATAGFLLAVLLLLAFTAAIVVTLRRGIRKPCKCFGAATTPLGRAHVVRNVLLLAAAVAGLVAGATSTASAEPAGVAIAAVAGLVGGLLVTRFDDLVELFGSQAIG